MTTHEREHLGAILAGFVFGVVAGAAVGLLFAPAGGRDTRQWIATRGREAGRRAAHMFDPAQATAIIRQSGVRGLIDAARWRRPDRQRPTGARADEETPA
jgi:hypothetical protein